MAYPRTTYELEGHPTPQDQSLGADATFYNALAPHRQYRLMPDKQYFVAMQPEPRSLTTLGGTPSARDIYQADYVQFFNQADRTKRYTVSADGTAYVMVGGSGGGTSNVTISTSLPQALGTANAGSTNGTAASAFDHVHALPTAAQLNVISIATQLTAAQIQAQLADGVAPTNNNTYVNTTAGTTAMTGFARFTALNFNDEVYWNPFLGASGQWDRIALLDTGLRTAGVAYALADGTMRVAVPGAGATYADYAPPIFLMCNVPVGQCPTGVIGSNGAIQIGVQNPNSATSIAFSQTTAGTGVTATVTGGTGPFVSTDATAANLRAICVGGVVCPITGYTSASVVTCTIPSGGISASSFSTFYVGTQFNNISGNGRYSGDSNASGVWVYFQQGEINTTVSGPGYAAGFYYTTWSTTMTGTIWNMTYAPGTNSGANSWRVPSTSGAAFSGTTGTTHNPVTGADLTTHQITATNPMGPYGKRTEHVNHRSSSSTGTKQVRSYLGATQCGYNSGSQTVNNFNSDNATLRMKGSTALEVGVTGGDPIHVTGAPYGAGIIETANSQVYALKIQQSSVNDYVVVESYEANFHFQA